MDFLREREIRTMDWPALSPDLNQNLPEILQQLTEGLTEEWDSISQEGICRFVRSMPRKWQEVIRAAGGHTRN